MTSGRPGEYRSGVKQVAERFYTVLDLPPEQFRQAYPLVQIVRANWSLEYWLDHAAGRYGRANGGGGVLSVQTQCQYIYALATFGIGIREADRRSIHVDLVCVVDFGGGTIRKLLVESLERRGRVQGCHEITMNLPEWAGMSGRYSKGSLRAALQKRGYVDNGDLLLKGLR